MVDVADGAPGSAGVATGADEAGTNFVDGATSIIGVVLWGALLSIGELVVLSAVLSDGLAWVKG